MKKYICALLCLVVLSGCAVQEEKPAETSAVSTTTQPTTTPPETTAPPLTDELIALGLPYIEDDWFELLVDNYNATIYLDEGGRFGDRLVFPLVAGRDLLEEESILNNLTLWTDRGKAVKPGVNTGLSVPMQTTYRDSPVSYPLFLSLRGLDWKALAEDETAFSSELSQYAEDYALLEKAWEDRDLYEELLPVPSACLLEISYEALGVDIEAMRQRYAAGETVEPAVIRKIAITLDGVTKEYGVNLEFRGEYCGDPPENEDSAQAPLQPGTTYGSPYGVVAVDGIIVHSVARRTGNQGVTLEAVTLINAAESETILRCEVELNSERIQWDGSQPLAIPGNTEFTMHFVMEFPGLQAKWDGSCVRYLLLEYSCGDRSYQSAFLNTAVAKYNPYASYAQTVNGIDMEGYYRDYYFAVEDPLERPEDHMEGKQ